MADKEGNQQHRALQLEGENAQLLQQIQQQQHQIHHLQQPQDGALQDPAALFQAHLAQDRHIKEREWEETTIEREVRRVVKCDGVEAEQVKEFLKEIGLVPAHIRIEVASRASTGPLRRELERFRNTNDGVGWEPLKNHMLSAFVSTDNTERIKKELEKIKQSVYETIVGYNRRFRELAEEAYPAAQRNDDQERALVKAYGKGLAQDHMARKLTSQGWPANLQAALNRMATTETSREVYDHLGRLTESMEVGELTKPSPQPPLEIQRLKSHIAKLEAQIARSRPPRQSSQSQPRCYNCNKVGHIARECRAPRQPRNAHTSASQSFQQSHAAPQ